MKRKKFIKLLMGLGVPRNVTEKYALAVVANGWTYADYYKRLCTGLSIAKGFRDVWRALRVLSPAVKEIADIFAPSRRAALNIQAVTRQEHKQIHDGYSPRYVVVDDIGKPNLNGE